MTSVMDHSAPQYLVEINFVTLVISIEFQIETKSFP